MKMNEQNDKTLAEDEAFIQSLYTQLEDNQHVTAPSADLDQRILDVAHAAVDIKPTSDIHDTMPTQRIKKQKKMAWYYPVTMAASVLLVVSLVTRQFDPTEVGLPSTQMNQDNSLRVLPTLENSSNKVAKALVQDKNNAIIARKRIEKEHSVALTTQPPLYALSTQSSVATQNKNIGLTAALLSVQQHKALQIQSRQQPLYWLLKQESRHYYVIELFTTTTTSTLYRLSKSRFFITKNTNKKQLFSEIMVIPKQ